jgi:hypothetical protein
MQEAGAAGRGSLSITPRTDRVLRRDAEACPHDDVARAFNTVLDALAGRMR